MEALDNNINWKRIENFIQIANGVLPSMEELVGLRDAFNRAETLAPYFDPTLYVEMNKTDRLKKHKLLLDSAIHARAIVEKIKEIEAANLKNVI